MAQNDKKKTNPKGTTPEGALGWPKLVEADYGSKEYPKPDGEYSTKLILNGADAATQRFVAFLKPLHDAAVANGKTEFAALKAETRKKLKDVTINHFYTELLDKETEQETGEIEFKFAMKASGEYKTGPKAGRRWTRTPALFDAGGNPIVGAKLRAMSIWGGTTAAISFEVTNYFIPGTGACGLKLNLVAAQIIELRSGSAQSAEQHGFTRREGGFSQADVADDADEGADKGASGAPSGPTDF